ncbi:tigger transposable element-derived protein 1-like isoform X3 [Macrobrachium nipponense]|uniref:tigger transposable element-derived protein 1-like isoform X3 n=1 Tax=Macrobrachium nipponense TaxID=159736 RepID=UPI0030C83D9E
MDSNPVTMSFSVNGRNFGKCYEVSHRSLQGKALFPHILTKNCTFKVNFGSEHPSFRLKSRYRFVGQIPLEERVLGSQGPQTRQNSEVQPYPYIQKSLHKKNPGYEGKDEEFFAPVYENNSGRKRVHCKVRDSPGPPRATLKLARRQLGRLTTILPHGKKRMLSMETKMEIIKKYEAGMRLSVIAKEYSRNPSTIGTILKQKEAIKAATPSKGVTIFSNKRSHVHDKMERLLLVWVEDKEIAGDTITEMAICQKASAIFGDLSAQAEDVAGEGKSKATPDFKASHGWFEKFRKRTGIHSVVRHGEAASSDTKVVQAFVKTFNKMITKEGYSSQQVFNCDETGLFWKKMPSRTYITEEEKKLPGHKPMKDRLTLALCSNASGDCKVKPLLVYHSETPRAFMAHKVLKEKLPVMWRANAKTWVTRLLFTEWVNLCFGPTVKKFLEEKRLPLKCLLVLDNATAHPPGLEEDILAEYSFIKVLYLPPNTTHLLQPMEQQVILNFKTLYTKHLFKRCFDITDTTNLPLREFWKKHFNIMICIRLIDQAWQEVSRQTLNSSWRKLWPDAVSARGFKAFNVGKADVDSETVDDPETVSQPDLDEIVALGKSMGLVVNEDDINDLLREHQEELTTDDLKELEALQHNVIQEEFSSSGEEEEEEDPMTTAEIKDVLAAFHKVQSFVEKRHPKKAYTGRMLVQFNDVCLSRFRNIVKSRQKQSSLDSYFLKRPFVVSKQEGPSDTEKQKIESGEEIEIL